MRRFNIRDVEILITEDTAKRFLGLLSQMSDLPTLNDIVAVDQNGLITSFNPPTKMPWGIIFFIQNVMISQRLFLMDEVLRKNEVIR